MEHSLKVAVEEYGCEGLVELPPQDWIMIKESQQACGRPLSKFEGVVIGLFDRTVVRIEVNDEDGRQQELKFTLVGLPTGVRGKEAPAAQLPSEVPEAPAEEPEKSEEPAEPTDTPEAEQQASDEGA